MQLIYALLVPFLLGIALFLLVYKKASLYLALAASYPIGCGILAFIMFLLGIARVPLNLTNISIAAWGVIILFFVFVAIGKRGSISSPSLQFRPIDFLLLSLIGAKVAYVFAEAMIKPVFTWDAWSRYAAVAKFIFIDHSFLTPISTRVMEDYPLLIPLNQSWIMFCEGYWNDLAIKIISPILFLSLLAIFYWGLRRSIGRTMSLFFTFLLSTLPFMVFHATTAYLDLPMTVYYSAGTIFVYLYLKNKEGKDLLLAAIFLGLGIWTKRAGIYLAGIDSIVLLGYLAIENREKLWDTLQYFIVLALIGLPWVIYNKLVAPSHHYTLQTLASPNPNFSDFTLFFDKMFNSANWHLAWILLVLAMVLFYKKITKEKTFLLVVILLNLAALAYLFLFTGSHQYLLDGTLWNRVMMYMMPVVLFFSGLILEPLLNPRQPSFSPNR